MTKTIDQRLLDIVEGSFAEGVSPEDAEWLAKNPAKAAKLYRYNVAVVWFWADQYIQQSNMTTPNPDGFMTAFRNETFARALKFFPGMEQRDGGKIMWALMFDDAEKMPELMNEVIADTPPYIAFEIAKRWFAKEGIDITGDRFAMWMVATTSTAQIAEKVKAVIAPT